MKRISITAFDYGAHPLKDKGITDSIKNGSLDNVCCMMWVNNNNNPKRGQRLITAKTEEHDTE